MVSSTARAARERIIRLERSEMDAWEDFYRAAPVDLVDQLGLHAVRIGGALVTLASRVDVLAFNRVIGAGIDPPVTGSLLDEIAARFEQHSVRRYFVQVAPPARPDELSSLLESRGLLRYNAWIRHHRGLPARPVTPNGVRIEPIGPEDGPAFGQLLRASFEWPGGLERWVAASVGRPGWTHYLAYDGASVVGTAAYRTDGFTAWLDFASTAPSHRGRGVQGALIARRLADATAVGCREAHMETAQPRPGHDAPAYRNAQRAGFAVLYERANFMRQRAG